MKLEGSSALITGASAGLGREFARLLADRVKTMVLVARRQDRLEELRKELMQRNPQLTIYLQPTDLARPEQLNRLLEFPAQQRIEIDLLINNAGLGDMGPFATSDPQRLEEMLLVNTLALTLLTRRLLPGMLRQNRGAILNVSSSAGFLPIPQFSVYAATKAYVTSFSEGLRAELRGTGLSVCALCPGPVHTEFSQVAQRAGQQPQTGPKFIYVTPADVARAGLNALERDRPLVVPGLAMKLGMTLVRLMPMALLRLGSNFSAKRRA
jgi:short-subunit dehydrogenase